MNQTKRPDPDSAKTEPASISATYEPPRFSVFEQICWTMVVLAPLLYLVNGPAVSTDQMLCRALTVTVAIVGGSLCRLRARRCR